MKPKALKGTINVPGDKSITHRALIFAPLLKGLVRIHNCSTALDCKSTAQCLKDLGLPINGQQTQKTDSRTAKDLSIEANGLSALRKPDKTLFAGNSGTTIRLLSGLLSGQPYTSILDGDESLRTRPMNRVTKPLAAMGAQVKFLNKEDNAETGQHQPTTSGYAPFSITGGSLTGQTFNLEIASAQVEAAILLAGLQADGITTVTLPTSVRDHTRRMFNYLGVPIHYQDKHTTSVTRLVQPLPAKDFHIPADMSSATFFIVAASLIPGSHIVLKDVGMNPGRLLALETLLAMGADIAIENPKEYGLEPVADLRVKFSSRLQGTIVASTEIARGIDEIPILALAGALSQGTFAVSGAEELRYKESDRLKAITANLQTAGAEIEAKQDGFTIIGKPYLSGGSLWRTYNDHRLAMTGLIANLICQEELEIEETDSINISYPEFQTHLRQLSG